MLSTTGCLAIGSDEGSVLGKDTLVVGVKADQPGLGDAYAPGIYGGFEVQIAKYIGNRLGADKVRLRAVTSEDRERMLDDGEVDLILASFSITPQRSTRVTFGGPYYVAHQDIMVRRGDQRITNVRDLADRRMCDASGSVSARRITEEMRIAARLVPAPTYRECLLKLLAGEVDAVSTGDLVLAGYAARVASSVQMVNSPFTDERYGVGLRKGDVEGCEAVNEAITQMYQDGSAGIQLRFWFGATGLRLTPSVPQFEGCV